MKPTAQQWKAVKIQNYFAPDQYAVTTIDFNERDGSGYVIARVADHREKDAEEIARLIAAAPALRDKLKEAAAMLDSYAKTFEKRKTEQPEKYGELEKTFVHNAAAILEEIETMRRELEEGYTIVDAIHKAMTDDAFPQNPTQTKEKATP